MSWNAVISEDNSAQLVKKSATFYGTQRFITFLQEPATGPYPLPDESNPRPQTVRTRQYVKV